MCVCVWGGYYIECLYKRTLYLIILHSTIEYYCIIMVLYEPLVIHIHVLTRFHTTLHTRVSMSVGLLCDVDTLFRA